MPRTDPIAVRTTPASRGPAYGGSAFRVCDAAPCPQAAAITAVTSRTAQAGVGDEMIGSARNDSLRISRKLLIG